MYRSRFFPHHVVSGYQVQIVEFRDRQLYPPSHLHIRYRFCFWGMAEPLNQGGVCLWDELVDMEDAFKFRTFSLLCLALPGRPEKWVFSQFYICLSQHLSVLIIPWWLNGDCYYISVFWKCRTKREYSFGFCHLGTLRRSGSQLSYVLLLWQACMQPLMIWDSVIHHKGLILILRWQKAVELLFDFCDGS